MGRFHASRLFSILAAASLGASSLTLLTAGPAAQSAAASTIGGGPGRIVIWGASNSLRLLTFEGAIAISARDDMALWLNWDGTVGVWRASGTTATNPPAGLSGVKAIAAGGNFAVALDSHGAVVVWGSNTYHQTEVPAAAKSGVVAIAAGQNAIFALKSDGSYVAWGDNTYGQLNAVYPHLQLGKIVNLPYTGLKQVSLNTQGIGLLNTGALVGWGLNSNGQATPPAGASGIKAVATGDRFSLALRSDGSIAAWGDNSKGQLNVPCITFVATGKCISVLGGYTAIAAGGSHAMAVKGGVITAWGDNSVGQSTVPVEASGNISGIAASTSFSFAIDGTPGAPPAPTEVGASGGDHAALVSFVPKGDGGAPLTKFTVTSSPGGITASCPAVLQWDGSYQCVVSGLQNNTSYTFTVTQTNGLGTGPASAPSNPVTPFAAQPFKVILHSPAPNASEAAAPVASHAQTAPSGQAAGASIQPSATVRAADAAGGASAGSSAGAKLDTAPASGSSGSSGDGPPLGVVVAAVVAVIAIAGGGVAAFLARGRLKARLGR